MNDRLNSSCLPEHIRKLMPQDAKRDLGAAAMTIAEISERAAVKIERELHKLILNELLRREIFPIYSRMDKRSTTACGTPDFCFVIGGYPIAVECKTATGQLSEVQRVVMDGMIKNGWAYYVVRSFEGFKEAISPYLGCS